MILVTIYNAMILCRIFLLVLGEFSNFIFSGFKPLDGSTVLMQCSLKVFASVLSSVIISPSF